MKCGEKKAKVGRLKIPSSKLLIKPPKKAKELTIWKEKSLEVHSDFSDLMDKRK